MIDLNPDYVINEYLDIDTFETHFRVISKPHSNPFLFPKTFETLNDAEQAVRLLRKYKDQPIVHYVD